MTDPTKPVLIVGTGPAGLTAAITLARLGIDTLLVERRETLSPFPRATGVSTRTMELIRSWGLAEQVRAGAIDVRPDGWLCPDLASAEGMPFPLGFPTVERALQLSPAAPALVPQDHLEPVLLRHLSGYRHATVRFGVELVDLDQDDTGVTAVLSDRTVRCSYVIGADGAHSAVRSAVGIGMHGPGELGDFLSALFRAPLFAVVGERRYGLYVLGPSDRTEVMLPAGDGDRWLYSRQVLPGEEYDTAAVLRLIRAGAGVPDLPVRLLRTGEFTFAALVAERYRAGRVFLAGDAAHRITPRGATGMNTAIHDAYDVGWKLAWVLRGWAPERLLDSYEAERRPVGARNAMRSSSTGPDGRDAFADDLGGRIPHVWQTRAGTPVSTLDLLGPRLTVLAGPAGEVWRTAAAGLPVGVHLVDVSAAEAFGITPSGALLVRPDGRPVEAWAWRPPHTRAVLRAAVSDRLPQPVRAGRRAA